MSENDLPGTLPDLSDPATLGCILALVRDTPSAKAVVAALENAAMGECKISADTNDPRFAALGEALGEALVACDEALMEAEAYCSSLRASQAKLAEARAEVERLRADVARLEADLLEAIGERDRMADHMRTGGGR